MTIRSNCQYDYLLIANKCSDHTSDIAYAIKVRCMVLLDFNFFPMSRELQEYFGIGYLHAADALEGIDIMLAIQAPAGFWGGVNWQKVGDLLTKDGVFIIDSDDDPASSGLSPNLTLTKCVPDFSIDFPSQVIDLTNGTNTIYEAREKMGFKRNVIVIRRQIMSETNETNPP